jgi:hypothetical protein
MDNIISDIAKHIRFRLVDICDAEFILSLRIDPKKNRFISAVENDLEAQRLWLADYKQREKNNEEYYFIIESLDEEKLGTIRIYDLQDDSFCWGSWILKQDAPAYAAIESALSIYEIGLYRLGFTQSHSDVRKGNQTVISFLTNFGAVITHEDDINYYFKMTDITYEQAKQKYKRFLKPLHINADTDFNNSRR